MPTLHRTASCFKLGFPGVRELRPSQQAPGIAVRVSLRRRERSSDVPCSEPPLQGSPRPSMPTVENRRFMWTCTVRCLHCMACGTCAHAGVRILPSRNAEPSAQGPRQGEQMRVAFGESTRRARVVVCRPKSRGRVNACPAAPSLSATLADRAPARASTADPDYRWSKIGPRRAPAPICVQNPRGPKSRGRVNACPAAPSLSATLADRAPARASTADPDYRWSKIGPRRAPAPI